jgi:hypothetical protein
MPSSIRADRAHASVALAMSLALACSSDETRMESTTIAGLGAEASAEAVYAIATQVFSSDLSETTTYVVLADQLESGSLSLDQGLEIPGRSYLWAPDTSGAFYVTSQDDLLITKYVLGDDGLPAQVDRVSVASAGVTALAGESMVFHDPGHAWLFDLSSAQAIEINLETMALERTVDVTALLDPDPARFPTTYVNLAPLRRWGPWVVGQTYAFEFEEEAFSTTSRLVFFDPVTGDLIVSDAPCGGLSYSARATNGDVFFSTDPLVAAVHALDAARAPAPCLVRLPAGAMAPDPVTVPLTPLTGGLPTGGLIPGSGDSVFLRVLDTASVPLGPDDTGLGLYGQPNWYTWRTTLSAPTVAERVERAPIAGGITFFELDGVIYQNESDAGFSATTLVRTTGADAPANAMTLPGVPFSIVKVR